MIKVKMCQIKNANNLSTWIEQNINCEEWSYDHTNDILVINVSTNEDVSKLEEIGEVIQNDNLIW